MVACNSQSFGRYLRAFYDWALAYKSFVHKHKTLLDTVAKECHGFTCLTLNRFTLVARTLLQKPAELHNTLIRRILLYVIRYPAKCLLIVSYHY